MLNNKGSTHKIHKHSNDLSITNELYHHNYHMTVEQTMMNHHNYLFTSVYIKVLKLHTVPRSTEILDTISILVVILKVCCW